MTVSQCVIAISPASLARAYAACEALARVALRELSGRVAAAAARRCGRTSPRSTRSRASPTTSPTKARRRPPTAGAARRVAAAAARRRRRRARSAAPPHAHEDLIVVALAHSIRSLDLPLALFDDLLSAFGQDTMTTRYASWADVFDYCRRSANPVGRLVLRIAGYRDERARSIVGRAVHGAAADELLAGLRPRLARRPAVRAARRAGGLPARARWISSGRSTDRRVDAPRSPRCVARDARSCSTAAAPSATACAAGCGFELRFTWLGGTRMLDGSSARGAALLTHRPTLGARDVPVAALARRCAGRSQPRLMARKTSFYYSFLVLPAEQRRAIIAVWDFCRAVDDAVDEEPAAVGRHADRPRGGRVLARGAGALLRRRRRRDTRRAGACSRSLRAFDLPRQAFEDVIDGVAMDLDTTRYADVRRPVRILPPRGLGGRHDLHPDLRLPQRPARASTR